MAIFAAGRRRFLNLIVSTSSPGVKTLRRINLAQLFDFDFDHRNTPPPPSKTMETLRLPPPTFTFRALNNEWNLSCIPFAGSKVICGDAHSGFGFILDDLESNRVETIPPLLDLPPVPVISVFVHKPDADADIRTNHHGSTLYLMARVPRPEPVSHQAMVKIESEQFVGFVNCFPSGPWGFKCLNCRRLPPPPFVRETWSWYDNNTPEITAYGAVVGGGSQHVCISVQGVGTYCLDTESHKWSRVGRWMIPFCGKVEYVPELELWFGLSADGDADDAGRRQFVLAAADLSDMMGSSSSSQQHPQLVGGPWKELVVDPPEEEEWEECDDPQIVSLGSGRFCIGRFFFSQSSQGADPSGGGKMVNKKFTVLTGVEVHASTTGGKGEGRVELQMTPHRSRRVNNASIETLF